MTTARDHSPRNRTRRLATVALVAAALAAAPVVAAPASAVGARSEADRDPDLLVSSDGIDFSRGSAPVLFTELAAVVPGDVERESIWIRSAAASDAELRIALVRLGTSDPELAEATTLELTGGCSPVTASLADAGGPGAPRPILTGEPLRPGETLRLNAELAVSPRLGDRAIPATEDAAADSRAGANTRPNAGRGGRLGFELLATLVPLETTGAGIGPDPRASSTDRRERCRAVREGPLSVTGSPDRTSLALLAVAAAALGIGIAAGGWRRRGTRGRGTDGGSA